MVLTRSSQVERFVDEECIPADAVYAAQLGQGAERWSGHPSILEDLKEKARKVGICKDSSTHIPSTPTTIAFLPVKNCSGQLYLDSPVQIRWNTERLRGFDIHLLLCYAMYTLV